MRLLPKIQRKKALFVGIFSSFIFRALGVLFAAYFIQFFYLQLIGGLYLLYLAIRHLYFPRKAKESKPSEKKQFWKVVLLIEFTDIVFALDSILAGVALIGVVYHPPNLPPKIWIVYLGGMIGLVFMRFAAKFFSEIIDKRPRLERIAHYIVGWVGLKLLIESIQKFIIMDIKGGYYEGMPLWEGSVFWIGIIALFVIGLIPSKAR